MKYSFQELQWDSEYFGVKSGKVTIYDRLLEKDFKELMAEVKLYEFVVINNMDNKSINNVLIGLYSNSFLVDTNIQFQMEVGNKEIDCFYLSQNSYSQTDKLIQIAKSSFNYSRFYNDPYLDINLSQKIYMQWVKNSFNNQNKNFIVAEENDKILGFLLFSLNEKKEIVIELIALDKDAQGQGTGTKLIKSLIFYAQKNEIKIINVGTQIDNLQAINFYSKKGFSVSSKNSIYHYWPRKGNHND